MIQNFFVTIRNCISLLIAELSGFTFTVSEFTFIKHWDTPKNMLWLQKDDDGVCDLLCVVVIDME